MWPPKRPVRPKSSTSAAPSPEERSRSADATRDRTRQALEAQAEALLPALLSFLASDEDRLIRFFDLTGLSPESLRSAAVAPGFAQSLLDYICADDRLVGAFCAAESLDPARLDALHQGLTRTVWE